jgi:O-antigen/teichoic acid export membrane protein
MTSPTVQIEQRGTAGLVRLWLHGLTWTILSSGLERIISLVQTVIVARILGIEDYGRYGLIFGTIGLVASIAGFQLGSTATAYVARYRQGDPAAAGGVIVLTEGLSLLAAIAGLIVVTLAPEQTAAWLLKNESYANVMFPAGVLVVVAVVSGVQDGILQGFEAFRALAWVRVVAAALTFVLILLIAGTGDLYSVLTAIVVGGVVRLLVMLALQKQLWRAHKLEYSWRATWSMRNVLWEFSLPSMLGNLLFGGVTWYGTYLLSRSPASFEGVAIASAAMQWRGPVLFLNASLATVAIPIISRLSDADARRDHIHNLNVRSNLAVAVTACAAIAAASHQILLWYGPEFLEQQVAFILIVVSVIGQSYVLALLQLLVGMRRIWDVLLYQMIFILPLGIGYWLTLPAGGLTGFTWITVIAWTTAALVLHVIIPNRLRKEARTQGD